MRNKYDALSGIATTQAFHGLLNSNCPFSHSNNFVFDKDGTGAQQQSVAAVLGYSREERLAVAPWALQCRSSGGGDDELLGVRGTLRPVEPRPPCVTKIPSIVQIIFYK